MIVKEPNGEPKLQVRRGGCPADVRRRERIVVIGLKLGSEAGRVASHRRFGTVSGGTWQSTGSYATMTYGAAAAGGHSGR
jgi:hypothetical protein